MPGFRRKRARDEQRVRVDANGLRREVVGEAGLGDEEIAGLAEQLDEQAAQLERQRRVGFAELPGRKADLKRVVQLAEQVAATATDVVVFGSGDLPAGIRAVAAALAPTAAARPTERDAPRLHVVDQLDPDRFTALLAGLDLERTLFNVVSATGEALATMSHFLIARDHLLRDLGAVAYQQHVVVTTRAGEGALRQIVNDEGFRALALPDALDEAAALPSAAALFPLACVGIDVDALLAGAAAMLERCRVGEPGMRPAHLVALAMRLATAGLRVIPPTTSRLASLATWIALRTGADDRPPATATTPFLPRRVALVIDAEPAATPLEMPSTYQDIESVGYLGGQRLDAVMRQERAAHEMARWQAGELTVGLHLPPITAHVVGQVVALTEAAVLLAGPPAESPSEVPHATRLAYGLLGRPGYEAERAAAQRSAARREDRYVA